MYPSLGDGCLARPVRDITCYLGNIIVEERYGQILRCCLGNGLYDGDMGMGHLWLKLMVGYLRLNGGAFMT